MNTAAEPDAKVLFRVPNDDGAAEIETLWAFDLGDDLYRLDNMPYFAYGVSLQDVVYAPLDESEGFPTFQSVHSKSGNRTVRIILDSPAEPGNASRKLLDGLLMIGCTLEGANAIYYAVTIPPQVKLAAVRNYLIESGAEWEHANPTDEEIQSGGEHDA